MPCQNHVDVEEGIRPCSRCGVIFCGDCVVEIQERWYCAGCKNEQMLDLRSGTDHWSLEYAHVGRRFLAQWIDQIVVSMPAGLIVGVGMVGLMFSGTGLDKWIETNPGLFFALMGVYVLVIMAATVTYEALMTGRKNGQTIGKMALKIRVVRPDGSPISRNQAWGRAFTRLLFFHILQLINILPVLFTKEKTCIHDMLAKTRVVRAE